MKLTEMYIKAACGKEIKVYKEILNKPGVYICHNNETNYIYIGKANDIRHRVWQHKNQLVKDEKKKLDGTRCHWQNSFNKRGKNSFNFYVIFYSEFSSHDRKKSEDSLYKAEEILIKKYKSISFGYNEISGGRGMDSKFMKEYWEPKGTYYDKDWNSAGTLLKELGGTWGNNNKEVWEMTKFIDKHSDFFINYPNRNEKSYNFLLNVMTDRILTNKQEDGIDHTYYVQNFKKRLKREWVSDNSVENFDRLTIKDIYNNNQSFKFDFTNTAHVRETKLTFVNNKGKETNIKVEGLMYFRPKKLDDNDNFSFVLYDFNETVKKANLTQRERETLNHLRNGLRNVDIERIMNISQSAVRHDIDMISKKIIKVGNKYDLE